MKQKLFLGALLFSFVLCSCNDDDIASSSKISNTPSIQLVQVSGDSVIPIVSSKTRTNDSEQSNYAIKFATQGDYENFITKMTALKSNERINYIDSIGLTSMQKILTDADKELDKIGNEATSEGYFRTKYQQYKNKYKSLFIFNTFDPSDLSPYMKDCGNDVNPCIVGTNHLIVIGNTIKKINFQNRMTENDSILFATPYNTSVPKSLTRSTEDNTVNENGVIYKQDGIKHIVSFYFYEANAIRMHLGAQKHMWYGWKRTSRDFFVKVGGIIDFHYAVNPDKDEGFTSTPLYMYVYENVSTYEAVIGYSDYSSASGTAQLWTEQSAEKDESGNYCADVQRGKQYPLCLPEKAINIRINLSHQ